MRSQHASDDKLEAKTWLKTIYCEKNNGFCECQTKDSIGCWLTLLDAFMRGTKFLSLHQVAILDTTSTTHKSISGSRFPQRHKRDRGQIRISTERRGGKGSYPKQKKVRPDRPWRATQAAEEKPLAGGGRGSRGEEGRRRRGLFIRTEIARRGD